jgi:transposase
MVVPECPGCRAAQARIAELEAKILELEGKLRDLMDKLKPPTAPRPASKLPVAPAKKPSGRKPGAQHGHPAHLKRRLPPERVNQVVRFVPQRCRKCAARLPKEAGPSDPPPTWHQVAELPPVAARITEYQGHYRTCPCCGAVNHAAVPDGIRAHSVGPRLSAALGYLAGSQGMSKRGLEEAAEAVFEAPIALGTVANLEAEMSAALAGTHREALEAVARAAVKNVDETGWKERGKKRWLWVAATGTLAAFLISPWRNLKALVRLLGSEFAGILCSDRWRVYDEWPKMRRQVCWAHLKRNWEKLVERGGKAKAIGQACLEVHRRVFELWHRYRGGGLSYRQLDEAMAPLMLALHEILTAGGRSRDRKLARHCARVLEVSPALWAFLVCAGVEPTNNHAERVLRRAVLWRRRSFGCQSADGCRFVERMLTVVQSLRLQKRSVLDFLHETLCAHRSGSQTPGLVLEG